MKQLIIVMLALSSCIVSFSQENKAVDNGSTQLFVGGGVAFNSVNITGGGSFVEISIEHPKTTAPVFIAGAKFTIKNTNNSLVITPSIRVYSFNSTAKKDLTSGLATYHHTSTFKAQPVISPTASIGYNIIRKPGFKWYVAGGLGFTFLFNAEESQSNYYDPSDTTISVARKPEPVIIAFNAQTGFDIAKKLGFWIFYQPPTDTNATNGKKVQIATLQAGLCYYFKSK
jgi:hypothetical protein